MKFEGGCYCGKIRYVAEGEPRLKAQCHCRECQYIQRWRTEHVHARGAARLSLHKRIMDSTDAVCGVRFTPGSRTIVGRSCPAPYDPYAVYGGSFSGLLAFEKLLADASNCGFKTLQQCMATVTGIGGSCEPNHFYNPGRSGRRGKAPARMMNT